jgi:hypothetical protein
LKTEGLSLPRRPKQVKSVEVGLSKEETKGWVGRGYAVLYHYPKEGEFVRGMF